MFLVHGRDGDVKERINDILFRIFPDEGVKVERIELDVGWNRTISVRTYTTRPSSKTTSKSVSRFDFGELCGGFGSGYADLGASDYRAIAKQFDIIVLENIPVLSDSSKQRTTGHNQARRFITLIDELYEAKTVPLCSAAAPISEIFVTTSKQDKGDAEDDLSGDMLAVDQATDSQGHAVGALTSVKELRFAFKRAASRLTEMTSSKWWQRHKWSSNISLS
jgi:protein AFG1